MSQRGEDPDDAEQRGGDVAERADGDGDGRPIGAALVLLV
jgi:hypothetical protein